MQGQGLDIRDVSSSTSPHLLQSISRTSYASVLTILAFSMERYLAICHPMYQYAMAGFNRVVKIIVLVWTISFLSALPYAFFTKLNYIDRPLGSGDYLEESAFCALLDDNIRPKVIILDWYHLCYNNLIGLPSLPAFLLPLLPPAPLHPYLPLC